MPFDLNFGPLSFLLKASKHGTRLPKQRPAISAIPAIPAVLDVPSASLNALNGRLASKNEATTVERAANHEGSLRTHQNMDPRSGPAIVETQPIGSEAAAQLEWRPCSQLDAHCPGDSGPSHIGGSMRQWWTLLMEQHRGRICIGSSRQSRLESALADFCHFRVHFIAVSTTTSYYEYQQHRSLHKG